MSQAHEDLQACAEALRVRFCDAYRDITGRVYAPPGRLVLEDVFYQLLSAGVIEVGPGLDGKIPL